MWDFWQWRQTKAQHIRQPNVAYFQDSLRKLGCKSEWKWCRYSQASRTVWSFGTQQEEKQNVAEVQLVLWKEESGEESPRRLLCSQVTLAFPQEREGATHRPHAPAFRVSSNWVLRWMLYNSSVQYVQEPERFLEGLRKNAEITFPKALHWTTFKCTVLCALLSCESILRTSVTWLEHDA